MRMAEGPSLPRVLASYPPLIIAIAPARLQVCKNKLGSHKRAKSKREDMAEEMRKQRMKA